MRYSTLIAAAACFELSIAGYVLEDDYTTDFYSNFNFFTGEDPTEGFVKYVDEATARKTHLINGTSTSVAQFGVDTQNKTPQGRPSIRIESKKKYDSGLIVLDVAHMPFGCGTWPAFWTIGPEWPENGEIDILEGVNEQINNAMTLHTAPGCEIGSDITQFSGELSTSNCDINASGQGKNVGCSIEHPSTQSYGAGLNANGGGVYATQWTSDAISVYFFPRGSIPKDVLGDSPNPSGWGKPSAKFTGGCNIDKMFNQQQIIIDTTFCGQWAGSKNVWNAGTCGKKAATCEEWVRDNPAAFTEAYWEINGMKVYQDNGKAPVAPPASAVPSKSAGLSVSAPAASKSSIVPPKPSGVVPPIPSSKVIPVVPSSTTKVPVAPVSTSKVAAPGVPTGSIKTPPAPIPTSKAAAPVPPPAGPQSSGSRVVARPSGTATSQIAAPSGAGGMEQGWQWPSGDGEEPRAPASNATRPALPAKSNTQKPTGAASSVVKPSGVPAASKSAVAAPAPAPSANAPPVVPFVPKGTHVVKAPVHTVYETVYKTVIARAVATPAPFARDVRITRHFKEHRRKQAVRA